MASIPFMITIKMKSDLKDLGISDEIIRLMTPQDAWDVLGGDYSIVDKLKQYIFDNNLWKK